MNAKQARQEAEVNALTKVERQLSVDSYVKWANARIKKRVADGELKVSPVFDGMDVPPNKETCEKLAEHFKNEGYDVAFNDKDMIVRISW